MANNLKASVEEVDHARAKDDIHTRSVEVDAVAAGLAAANEAFKPSLFSKGMLRLWGIVWIPNPYGFRIKC